MPLALLPFVTSMPESTAQMAQTIDALGPWFHNLRLSGLQTAPRHFLGDYPRVFFERFAHALPEDLRGWRVLDVGCNAGFYCFEMRRRGAAQVVGLEVEPLYLRQAQFAAAQLGMARDVAFREGSVYDVDALGLTYGEADEGQRPALS